MPYQSTCLSVPPINLTWEIQIVVLYAKHDLQNKMLKFKVGNAETRDKDRGSNTTIRSRARTMELCYFPSTNSNFIVLRRQVNFFILDRYLGRFHHCKALLQHMGRHHICKYHLYIDQTLHYIPNFLGHHTCISHLHIDLLFRCTRPVLRSTYIDS